MSTATYLSSAICGRQRHSVDETNGPEELGRAAGGRVELQRIDHDAVHPAHRREELAVLNESLTSDARVSDVVRR